MDVSDIFLAVSVPRDNVLLGHSLTFQLAKCVNYVSESASTPFFAVFVGVWTYVCRGPRRSDIADASQLLPSLSQPLDSVGRVHAIRPHPVSVQRLTASDSVSYDQRATWRPLEDMWMVWW